MFSLSSTALDRDQLSTQLAHQGAGAIVVFEGWVRDHNQGKKVKSLEYQIYRELATKEGERILSEAKEKFNLHQILAIHREGHLQLGDIAIWIGATATHRDDAFKATRYVIDEIKHRLPIWKKEHYVAEEPTWVFCRDHHHHVHFEEVDYYAKQALVVSQEKLKKARVLVIGAGGLGCPVLVNLACSGVGHIKVVDPDQISLSNVHRQFLYTPHLVGEKKALVARSRVKEINPFIQVEAIIDFFRPDHLSHIDLVIDCTDSMKTKYFIHDVCLKNQIPFISAGVFKHEAQLRTIVPQQGCLRCFVTETPDDSLLGNCNDFGVVGAWTSVVGAMQASEAIEWIQQGRNASSEATLHVNLKNLSLMKIKNKANLDCPTCFGKHEVRENTLEVDHVGEGELLDIRELSDHDLHALAPSENKLILCCHHGVRSLKLTKELRELGHKNVFSLKGGASSTL
jgi:adenylyltransferase/sulfurtransferase